MGTIPAIAHSDRAFSLLRVDDAAGATVERWIPSEHDIEVHMPRGSSDAVRLADRGERASDVNEVLVAEPKHEDAARGIRAARGRTAESQPPGPTADALLSAGLRELISGHADRARDRLEECIRLDRMRSECHRVLGLAFQNLGRTAEARYEFRRYLELAPNAVDAPRVRRLLEN